MYLHTPLLDLDFFNSPPPLFFSAHSALLFHMKCDLFYLALWVSKAGFEIEHFITSRLRVPHHILSQTGIAGHSLVCNLLYFLCYTEA